MGWQFATLGHSLRRCWSEFDRDCPQFAHTTRGICSASSHTTAMQLSSHATNCGRGNAQPAARCRSRPLVAAVPAAAASTCTPGAAPALASALVASWAAASRRRCSRLAAAAAQQLEQPPPSSRSDSEDGDAQDFAVALAEIADATKATDISVLHVAPLVNWTSYMLLLTVMSRPQLLAVLGRMEDAAAEWGRERQNSGRAASQWECLDFGDVVVHAFTSETREFYSLDDFFAAAEEVALPFAPQPADGHDDGDGGSDAAAAGSGGPVWAKSL